MKKYRIVLYPCVAYILIVTIMILYVTMKYGVNGTVVAFFLLISSLQLFKIVYEKFAQRKKYDLNLVYNITNCWTIYQILNLSLITSAVFSYLIFLANIEALHISKSIWLVIIIVIALIWTITPIQPFVRKENYQGKKRYPAKLICAFVPRFVILYTFVVYYFIVYMDSTEKNIIPSLCVVYLAIDRLIAMYNTIEAYAMQEYYSLFRDTIKWIRKIKGIDKENGLR